MKIFYLGIDVSKEKLDLCLLCDSQVQAELVIENKMDRIKEALLLLLGKYSLTKDSLLICAEYTGGYTYPLCCACEESDLNLWLENPTQIKYRSGIQRGKNDKLDARKIAAYACRFNQEARLFKLPEKAVETLKQLISERDLLVLERSKFKGQLTDQQFFMDKTLFQQKKKRFERLIDGLNESITEIDQQIKRLIQDDDTLSKQHKLLCSVDGIGERTAIKMIVETNGFKDFSSPRKFCCHAGVVPFEYKSGSSQRTRNKVSDRADKSIKTLLHMAALVVATRMKGELNDYFVRKVAQGKNKMSVINAVRAKLIHRMFAVIRNEQPYQRNYVNLLA